MAALKPAVANLKEWAQAKTVTAPVYQTGAVVTSERARHETCHEGHDRYSAADFQAGICGPLHFAMEGTMDDRKKNSGKGKRGSEPLTTPKLAPMTPERLARVEANRIMREAKRRHRVLKGLGVAGLEVMGWPAPNPLAGVFTVSEIARAEPLIYKIFEQEWEEGSDEYPDYREWLEAVTEIISLLRSGARPDDGVVSEPLRDLQPAASKPVIPERVREFAQDAGRAASEFVTGAFSDGLEVAIRDCESPIEQLIAVALARASIWKPGLFIFKQAEVLAYRADFLIAVLTYPTAEPRWAVIECDGHEFHERTPEQAEHDRRRDREMQAAGYRVFRFTGREIWRDPQRCVDEVMAYLFPPTGPAP